MVAQAVKEESTSEMSGVEQIGDTQEVELNRAPLTARILAAFVDYLLILCISLLLRGQLSTLDWNFLMTFVFGGLYYTVGNSELMRGQTLGKKAFGLRVVKHSPEGRPLLSLPTSFKRYFFCFGLALLVAEIPSVFLRSSGVVASVFLLEANMLVAMSISMSVIFSVFFEALSRGFHDRLSNSLVIRSSAIPSTEAIVTFLTTAKSLSPLVRLYPVLNRRSTPVICGIALATLFWSLGVLHPKPVQRLSSHRYRIESRLPIRIASIVAVSGQKIEFQGLVGKEVHGREKEISTKLINYIHEENLSDISSNYSVELVLYSLHDTSAEPYRDTLLTRKGAKEN